MRHAANASRQPLTVRPTCGRSFSVVALADRVRRRDPGRLTAHALAKWLLAEGLAESNGAPGRLELTDRGAELATAVADSLD